MAKEILLYLPESAGRKLEFRRNAGLWKLAPPPANGVYRIALNGEAAGTEFRFRYRDPKGSRHPIMPLSGVENLRGRYFVEPTEYNWQHSQPKPGHARVCLESSMEGLLAGYSMGRHAPGELQDLQLKSIASRICDCQLPERLSQFAVDEVMAPLFPSVADRTHLNPKFNYLVYDIGTVDWQLGRPTEFKQLIDRFFGLSIAIVPDLIFAHAVRAPFPGAMDTLTGSEKGQRLMADERAFFFRNYGTWMYDWENGTLRTILLQKLLDFFCDYRFPTVRVDFVDGMIFQYKKRSSNAAEEMLRELSIRLRKLPERPVVVGEAFSTAANPVVQSLIDVPYRPRGFCIAEQLYRPPSKCSQKDAPDIGPIVQQLKELEQVTDAEAVYAQLHDEAWDDEHIRMGRPDVNWAYGAQPAQLAMNCGIEFVASGAIGYRDLLDFTRRRVRGVEALTMFCATTRYLMLASVDSLGLDRLDAPGRWRMTWDDPVAEDMRAWIRTGLEEAEVFRLHDQHRADMVRLRRLFRELTPIDEERHRPLIRVRFLHSDLASAVLCICRVHMEGATSPVLALFNFGQTGFPANLPYQVPLASDLAGRWRVLFDGDGFDCTNLRPGEKPPGYGYAQEVTTGRSDLYQRNNVLSLGIGSNSLLVLQRS